MAEKDLQAMTNQEAMRGRAGQFLMDRYPECDPLAIEIEEMAEFALQEVASRDARIAKLEAALKFASKELIRDPKQGLVGIRIGDAIWEALKEQP